MLLDISVEYNTMRPAEVNTVLRPGTLGFFLFGPILGFTLFPLAVLAVVASKNELLISIVFSSLMAVASVLEAVFSSYLQVAGAWITMGFLVFAGITRWEYNRWTRGTEQAGFTANTDEDDYRYWKCVAVPVAALVYRKLPRLETTVQGYTVTVTTGAKGDEIDLDPRDPRDWVMAVLIAASTHGRSSGPDARTVVETSLRDPAAVEIEISESSLTETLIGDDGYKTGSERFAE